MVNLVQKAHQLEYGQWCCVSKMIQAEKLSEKVEEGFEFRDSCLCTPSRIPKIEADVLLETSDSQREIDTNHQLIDAQQTLPKSSTLHQASSSYKNANSETQSNCKKEPPASPTISNNQEASTSYDDAKGKASRCKKKQKRYTEQELQTLLSNIRKGTMSMYHVTKYYGIPHSTLQFRLSLKCKQHEKRGRLPVLLADEEEKLCTWLREMERKGFPITQQRLKLKISSYLKANPRPNVFKANIPGRKWITAFLRRHPQFSMRTPEAVTVASARVSEEDIRRWFNTVSDYIKSHDLEDILQDPSRVLNGDESGFSIQPASKRVIATKGKKNIPIVEPGNAKQNVTVMYTFAADGTVIPPHVVLPYKRFSKELIQSFPGDWGIGTNASGWMDTPNFMEYIKKVLYPTLLKNKTKFPVLFFVDGHKSHTTFEAAELCEKLGIILVALYPNTTRILQPADVAVFHPLKNSWARVIDEMKSEDPTETVMMLNFGKLLHKANSIALKRSTIANGFRTCGLFPFDSNAVDYSKCLAKKHVPAETADTSRSNAALVVCIPLPVIEEAKNLIGQDKIKFLFSTPFAYLSQSERALYYIYKNILLFGEPMQVAENNCSDGVLSPEATNEDVEEACKNVDAKEDTAAHAEVFSFLKEDLILNAGENTSVLVKPTTDTSDASGGNEDTKMQNYTPNIQEITLFQTGKDTTSVSEENTLSRDILIMAEPSTSDASGGNEDTEMQNYALNIHEIAALQADKDTFDVSEEKTLSRDTPIITEPITPKTADGSLKDVTNANIKRKLSISDFLTTPPTPKRSSQHRNYKVASYSVLTASERLAEMQKIEMGKVEAEKLKKEKAETRARIKLEKQEAKRIKNEGRMQRFKIKEELKKKAQDYKENRKRGKKKSNQV